MQYSTAKFQAPATIQTPQKNKEASPDHVFEEQISKQIIQEEIAQSIKCIKYNESEVAKFWRSFWVILV